MRYYNVTRGSVAVTLSNGSSCVFAPKAWTDVPADADGSAGLNEYVSKGILVRNAQDVKSRFDARLAAAQKSAPKAAPAKPVPAAVVAPSTK